MAYPLIRRSTVVSGSLLYHIIIKTPSQAHFVQPQVSRIDEEPLVYYKHDAHNAAVYSISGLSREESLPAFGLQSSRQLSSILAPKPIPCRRRRPPCLHVARRNRRNWLHLWRIVKALSSGPNPVDACAAILAVIA